MLIKTSSSALQGIEAYVVEVEVDIGPGLPDFIIVGLPEESHEEAPAKAEKARQTVKELRVPARSTNAIAVARSAG